MSANNILCLSFVVIAVAAVVVIVIVRLSHKNKSDDSCFCDKAIFINSLSIDNNILFDEND